MDLWLDSLLFLNMSQEFPVVRYRAPKGNDDSPRRKQDLIPSMLASAIFECISTNKSTIPNYPQKETCDLLIVDRPVDQVMVDSLMVLDTSFV